MFTVDWENIKEEDLKDVDFLIKAFRKWLKKECNYSAEAAKFAANVIHEPFARNYQPSVNTFVATMNLCGKTYEIFYCEAEDCADAPFEFYTLVDVASKGEAHYGDQLLPYIISKKKFILPSKYNRR